MSRAYEIWWPGYNHQSGGIRALHVLRDELRARGHRAWMRYEHHEPDAIGIYPEVVKDNPEQYQHVVRWLLNKANLPADGLTYQWVPGMGDHPLLTVDIIEPHLFTPFKGRRKGTAYWVGKGRLDPRFLPDGCQEIGRENIPTRGGLAATLRSVEYLISFDPFSAVNLEAVLLGTPVLIRNGASNWGKDEVVAQGWLPYGVAWGMDEMEHARSTVHLAYDHYQSLRPVFAERIDQFVIDTQAAYG